MKKLLYVLLLLIEGLLMAGTGTPVSSPQHGPQNPSFDFRPDPLAPFSIDEVGVKHAHASDSKQAHGISSPYNTPVLLTPAAPYRRPGLVRSSSDSQLVYPKSALGLSRATVLARVRQHQDAQKQGSKAE